MMFVKESDDGKYVGPERRLAHRRISEDRREMLRFQPGKGDRRCGEDRREGNGWNTTTTA